MRTTFFTLLTAVLAAVVTAERAPAPGTSFLRDDQNSQVHGNQVTRQELFARANHPDLFEKRQTTSSGSPFTCNAVVNQNTRRRDRIDVGNILTAEETAAFLLGRGSFTWSVRVLYIESLSPSPPRPRLV
jgi:hypothetical protein